MKFPERVVMLVDDNETDNFIHQRVLEMSEFSNKIIVMNSGKEGLEYLWYNQKLIENLPDLIFLDINMPVINGFTFLAEFEKFPPEIKSKCKIVILSSSENTKDKDRISQDKNVVHYITKPLSVESLDSLKIELPTFSK